MGVGYGIGHGGVEAALLAGVNAAVNAAVMLGAPAAPQVTDALGARGGGRVLGCRCRTHRGNGAAYGAVHPGVDGGHPARSHLVLFSRRCCCMPRRIFPAALSQFGAAAEHVVQ